MRPFHPAFGLTLLAVAIAAGCRGAGRDRVLEIGATGTVQGLVFFDGNGSGEPEEGEAPIPGVGLRLLPAGTQDTIARTTTDLDGIFTIARVPVGTYELVADPASVPDSVQVVNIEPPIITFSPDDTVFASVAIGFPTVSVEEARTLPTGARVFVEGIALNGAETFGDMTVHLTGATLAIRLTRVQPLGVSGVLAGDSLRVLGTASRLDGQPTLDEVTPFLLSVVGLPAAELVASALAASADGGRLDAQQVRVDSMTITDTATVAGDFIITADDGSGPLAILFDQDIFFDLSPFAPGVVFDASGVLVPTGTGDWRLKPRGDSDLTVQ